MLDPVLLSSVTAALVILMTLLLVLVWRKVNVLAQSNADQVKAELVNLLERNDETLKSGLNDSRKELRDVSSENRREMNDLFKGFQDTLLKRVVEISGEQNRQLTNFKDALNALSERLINNSNEFKQSVSESFSASSAALNSKQDEFRERTLERLNAFQEGIQINAKENRQELNNSLKSFEEKFAQSIKDLVEQLQGQFIEFNKQQDAFGEKTIGRLNGFQEGIQKDAKDNRQELNTALKSFEEKSAQAIKQLSEHLQTQFVEFNKQQDAFGEKTIGRLNGFQESIQNNAKDNRTELNVALKSFETKFGDGIKDFNEQLRLRFNDLNKQQLESLQQSKTSITEVKDTIEKQLKAIREDNTTQLNEMRRTVDEKLHDTLEKRLGESFKLVSDRLEQVHKGLGEMQTLAVGVGDLKKVLSNVKTRGILGEYQLGNILEQILSPEQYSVNVATKQGSRENVEYAVKLPGKSDEQTVWLPIDSKFPLEGYQALLNALEEGNPGNIDAAQKLLLKAVESFAKDISSKYIDPPNTTDFAIMFLPVESLYAEVLRHPEMFERLQRTYRVTITGPTTLSALLNSLNMGFRTLAVQKRSSEVWKVLAEVKTEFVKYSEQLATVHKHLNTATTSLEKLQTTRTNAMARKLNSVDGLEFEMDGTPTLAVPVLEEDD
jgi:DNA recombination protein RmuC